MVNETVKMNGTGRMGARKPRAKKLAKPLAERRPGKRAGFWQWLNRRLFSRRKKVRRRLGQPNVAPGLQAGRHRIKMTKILGAVLIIAAFPLALWLARAFFWDFLTSLSCVRVDALRVHGARVVEVKRIRELAGIIENRSSMLAVDEEAVARRIHSDPWVSKVTVNRDWLDMAVDITITENEPMALVNRKGRGGAELWYADARGDGFLPMKIGQDADYPVISGLDFLPDEKDRHEALATIMGLLTKAARVTKDARQKNLYLTTPTISEILVTPERKLVLFLVDYPFPIFLGKDTEKQFKYLADALGKLYGDMKNLKIEDIVAIEVGYYGDERIRLIRKIKSDEAGDGITGNATGGQSGKLLL